MIVLINTNQIFMTYNTTTFGLGFTQKRILIQPIENKRNYFFKSLSSLCKNVYANK